MVYTTLAKSMSASETPDPAIEALGGAPGYVDGTTTIEGPLPAPLPGTRIARYLVELDLAKAFMDAFN